MKKKIKLQTLKGFRDFLPEEAIKRQCLYEIIRSVAESFGYDPLETPTLEYGETLLGKYGDEADKLLYLFKDRGARTVGLKYDQTVPLARVVAQYPAIPMPFRRYQFQSCFRQEKPQKGRFREFTQLDIDILGLEDALADAEIVAIICAIYKKIGFKRFTVKLNSREILMALLAKAKIPEEKRVPAIRVIDKKDKIGINGVIKELSQKLDIKKNMITVLVETIKMLSGLEDNFGSKDKPLSPAFLPRFQKPLADLKLVFNNAIKMGASEEFLEFDPTLARGLDYYTGTIFEVMVEGYKGGSVLAGGRYDKLIGMFSGKDVSGVGFGLGFDRTLEAASEFGLIPDLKTKTKVLVTVFSDELVDNSIKIANFLRGKGVNTEIYTDPQVKLDKQLKYADRKGISFVIICGPDEVKNGLVVIKEMKTGKQRKVKAEEAVKALIDNG